SLTERVIDLRHVPSGLFFGAWLATTWEFLDLFLLFKDTRGNVVTMSEYLCFPSLLGASTVKGIAIPANHPVGQSTTPPLPVDQPIPNKTDSQREVEVEDPKVVAAREEKKAQVARAVAKKKESKKRGNDEGSSSRAKKRRGPEGTKSASASSGHVSSPIPLRTVAPVNQVISLQSGDDDGRPRSPNDERHSPLPSLRGKVTKIPIHPTKERVLFSETHADESSHPEQHLSTGAPVSRPRQILTDTLKWCRELMVHLAPPIAQEESNSLTNDVALQRAWFSLARGAMAQTNILERFENLLAEYDTLADTHVECSETVRKLVTARQDLEHNANVYTDAINRYKSMKEEHAGCGQKAELARKDSMLTYTERMLAEGANDHEKLTAQPGYRHSVADLLKVHLDLAPSTSTSTPTISKALGGSGAPPKKKT
ncbi:hypothetical protein Tco_0554199, partial [Tanacetum coccineum]